MRLVKFVEKTGILLVLGTGFFAPKALAEITVYNVNAIHELYSENELAAKKIYHNKNALVFGRVDKVDNEHVIIEGDSEFCLLYTSPSPRDRTRSRMPSSA